ncbi:hypothetical protein H8356DRAFT_1653046 [Neocallimastix lanati (nom. inval.)]|uniref:Uncharacterized protein n=1 Tax=Neocallimastix californiae TaxID=1754190 RepID=A0A1Y2F2F9_9FUNG|nr:hypothetical protein H8356DRAFT_1653046 [Neocallimastix sp. JGI-2020a]ORY77887.1 hypothetical protein LY90DRAFT_501204 [Neocallimastix californiae]|eukprot:ORY77887.1 hypothetical protein LY90DRAFT_501204 [Neocallimastix californiae]
MILSKPNMKILNSKERAKKIKLLQEIRVRFINCLLSYGDCLQYMKQLQKDNKELVLNKKSNEISLNQKIGKLINEIEYITNDIDDYQSHKKLRQEKIETQYNKFSKIIEKSMIELDIVYYKKKKEYEDLLIELEQLKQFEEKVNTHPELLLKEIEILHNKINENDENYKNELKRMQFREKNKLKEMDDKKQQNINYLILESYNHVSPKLIQAYLDRVENNKRLHYESRIQKEFQENLKKEIDRLKKENENIKKSNTKKINTYNKISSTEKYKIKCPPNEIYKFESIDSSERKKMTKKQILLSKIHDLKALSPIKKENNTLEHVAISPSNLALIDEVTQVLNFTKSNILLYNKNNKEIREKLFHKNITGFYTYINGKNTDSSYNKSQTSIDISNK